MDNRENALVIHYTNNDCTLDNGEVRLHSSKHHG
jgi:hypothetical protein